MSYNVLIIDDEPLICMGILELIDWKQYGFTQTDIRFNYTDGLRAALEQPYNLIISDIRIHDASGLDLIRVVQEKGMCRNFVLISAYAEFEYAQKALQMGVREYLLKPLKRDELEQCITRVLKSLTEEQKPEVSARMPEPREQEPERTAPSVLRPKKHTDIEGLLEYIHVNYSDPGISLTRFANEFYVNPSYLGQRFRQRTGIKFTDYVNQYRVVKACELLMQDRYLIYEISEKVGFGNITYFHRVFKKITGYGTEEFKKKVLRGLVEIPSLPQREAQPEE